MSIKKGELLSIGNQCRKSIYSPWFYKPSKIYRWLNCNPLRAREAILNLALSKIQQPFSISVFCPELAPFSESLSSWRPSFTSVLKRHVRAQPQQHSADISWWMSGSFSVFLPRVKAWMLDGILQKCCLSARLKNKHEKACQVSGGF